MKPSAQKVLTMLRTAGNDGVTTGQFLAAYQGRFGARLFELGILGFEIDSEPVDPKQPRGPQRYRLIYEPDDLAVGGGAPVPPPAPTVDRETEVPVAPGGRLFDTIDIDIPPPRPALMDPDVTV